MAQLVENPAVGDTDSIPGCREDLLEKVGYSSILTWEIPWTVSSMGS